jgi:hypothetical protein
MDVAFIIVVLAGLVALALVATYHIGKSAGEHASEHAAVERLRAWEAALNRYRDALAGHYAGLRTYHAGLKVVADLTKAAAPPELTVDTVPPPPGRFH